MKKKEYISPEMTVVSFKIERGFVGSNKMSLIFDKPPAGYNNQGIQNMSTDNANAVSSGFGGEGWGRW